VHLNGALAGNVSSAGGGAGDITPLASTSGLHIGADRVGTGQFDGLIDEVAIWDRALDATDVSALYNGGAGINLVPEPSTALLLGMGLTFLGAGRRRLH
jgi:hypothetical protein